jgi:hypothetical protein
MKAASGIGIFFLLAINSVSLLNAQVFLPDFAQQLVVNGITNPTAMAFAPDG